MPTTLVNAHGPSISRHVLLTILTGEALQHLHRPWVPRFRVLGAGDFVCGRICPAFWCRKKPARPRPQDGILQGLYSIYIEREREVERSADALGDGRTTFGGLSLLRGHRHVCGHGGPLIHCTSLTSLLERWFGSPGWCFAPVVLNAGTAHLFVKFVLFSGCQGILIMPAGSHWAGGEPLPSARRNIKSN